MGSHLKKLLLILIICFLSSCAGRRLDWTPATYVPIRDRAALFDSTGDIVPFDSERIEEFSCFPDWNIAELAAAIERIKYTKIRRKLRKRLRIAIQKRNSLREN